MKKVSGLILLMLILGAGTAFGWGNDVKIYSGPQIRAFDVDYNLDNGDMFLAFQANEQDIIHVYQSTNHGYTWYEILTLNATYGPGTPARSNLNRIRLLYADNHLYVFFVDIYRYFIVKYITLSPLSENSADVSNTWILEESFDVTQNLNDGRLFACWSEGNDTGDRIFLRYSDDNGATWNDAIGSMVWGNDGGETRQNLVYGPKNNIFWSYAYKFSGINAEIITRISPDNTTSWPISLSKRLTNNSFKDYDPRGAAANVNDSGVWVLYNRDLGGNVDLYFHYSPDAGVTWNPTEYKVSASGIADEYIADIKFYKYNPNIYMDMVYIYDNPSATPVRKAIWAYTSTSDPTHWKGDTVVNDQDVQASPPDVAPRIVYSPGATAPGGGVVFSYYGRNGIYFDAPWIQTATHTLTVTVNGSGNVTSDPPGIDCTNDLSSGPVICSYEFNEGETVALTATPIDGETWTASFGSWSGDGIGATVRILTMDANKSVTAQFAAVGIPVFSLTPPDGQYFFGTYPPVQIPVLQPDESQCKPFAVGDLLSGNLNLRVALPHFFPEVDVYLAFYSGDLAPGTVYMITAGNVIQTYDNGFAPWMVNTEGDIDELLFGTIPLSALPSGTYYLYVVVTPAGTGDLSLYYFWGTYFVVP